MPSLFLINSVVLEEDLNVKHLQKHTHKVITIVHTTL